MNEASVDYEIHDVSLEEIQVIECSVSQESFGDEVSDENMKATWSDLKIKRSIPNPLVLGEPVTSMIDVEIGHTIVNPVYRIKLRLIGFFIIPSEKFDAVKAEAWAMNAAYFLLLPYVREVLFSATKYLPSGPYMVPLIVVPQIPRLTNE